MKFSIMHFIMRARMTNNDPTH